jgi:TRAP-type C4-dicarboxylate transport system permease large subunit
MRTVTDYTFGVIPMFLLMGTFVSNSGMSRELFRAANGFVGHLRGGLGIATIAACGGFAAICGCRPGRSFWWHGWATCPPCC